MKYNTTIYVGEQKFNVHATDKSSEIETGLMHQLELPEDSGVLFVYDEPAYHGIWMKNTYIPLDVIWFDENKVVIDKATLLPEDINNNVIVVKYPIDKSKYILEIDGGTFNGNLGDIMEFDGDK